MEGVGLELATFDMKVNHATPELCQTGNEARKIAKTPKYATISLGSSNRPRLTVSSFEVRFVTRFDASPTSSWVRPAVKIYWNRSLNVTARGFTKLRSPRLRWRLNEPWWENTFKMEFSNKVISRVRDRPRKGKKRDRPFFCSRIEGALNVRAISVGDLKVSSIITHKI